MRCPNCGGDRMYFVAKTDAHFEAIPDERGGFRIGKVIMDPSGVDCINESVYTEEDNIEFKCPYCFSSFEAEDLGHYHYVAGDEL